jgi:hypothetical protein
MANPTPKTDHLQDTQWQPGQSGNPAGKPKGTKHLATYIREMLTDENFEQKLKDGTVIKGAPVEAIVRALIIKASKGNLRAFDLLSKYGYGTKVDVTSDDKPLPVPIYGGLSVRPWEVKVALDGEVAQPINNNQLSKTNEQPASNKLDRLDIRRAYQTG